MRRLVGFCQGICMVLLATAVQAAPITIDDLADPDPEVIGVAGDSSPFTDSVIGSAGVLGGDRDFTADWIGSVTIPFGSSTSIGEGRLRLATFAPTDVVKITLDYPTFSSEDITDGGSNDTFRFDLAFVEGGSSPTLSLDITVSTGSGVGEFSGEIPESPGGPTVFFASFADFTGTPDFSDVTGITIVFNDSEATAVDFELDRPIITTNRSPLPEPSGVVLLFLGMGSVGMARWRRSRRQAATV